MLKRIMAVMCLFGASININAKTISAYEEINTYSRQEKGTCVPTCLSYILKEDIQDIKEKVKTDELGTNSADVRSYLTAEYKYTYSISVIEGYTLRQNIDNDKPVFLVVKAKDYYKLFGLDVMDSLHFLCICGYNEQNPDEIYIFDTNNIIKYYDVVSWDQLKKCIVDTYY